MTPFVARQIDVAEPEHREHLLLHLRSTPHPVMVLNTCQRLEVFGFDNPSHHETPAAAEWREYVAFERLARIAAGLESRILGELEILGQVRTAYKEFQSRCDTHDTTLDRIFQDALSLARRARKESGIDRNVTSLSALAGRELIARVSDASPVAVIGAGSMASSVARYLAKRGSSPVRVTSRCPDRAMALALQVGGFSAGLDGLGDLLDGVAGIICATAAPHPVLYPKHVQKSLRPLHIIDLGTPADCHDDVRALPKVEYIPLESIEQRAQHQTEDREARATVATRIIKDGAMAWAQTR